MRCPHSSKNIHSVKIGRQNVTTKPEDHMKNIREHAMQIGLWGIPDEAPMPYRKAVQIVHSRPMSTYSLIQRKLTNVWLKNASENNPDSDGFYSIAIKDMMSDMGYDGNNRVHIKDSARALMRVAFEWDVLSPDSNSRLWEASVLFPSVSISSSTVKYQISPQLRGLIKDPAVYAMIDMRTVKKFSRSSSIALYEFCIRFERLGRTKHMHWRDIRDMLCHVEGKAEAFDQYKYFMSKILKPAMIEISAVSEISIDYEVTKLGKSIDTISFIVRRIPNATDKVKQVETEEEMLTVGELACLKVPQSETLKQIARYGLDSVNAALRYTQARIKDTSGPGIEQPAAYFRTALQSGWRLPEDQVPEAKVEKPKTVMSKADQKERLENAYLLDKQNEAEEYFNELNPEEQDSLVDRYNAQQAIPSIRVDKRKKSGRASKAAFLRWLTIDTWGKPTADQLLTFASERILA